MVDLKCTDVVVRIVCVISGAMIAIAAIVDFNTTFQGVIVHIYLIIFGVLIILWEFAQPFGMGDFIRFYHTWLGRGLWFLFLGCLTLRSDVNSFSLWAGVFVLIVAFSFMILGSPCIAQSPPPKPATGGAQPEPVNASA